MKKLLKYLITTIVFSSGILLKNTAFCQGQELQQLLLNIEKLTQLKSILSDMKTGYRIYEQGYGAVSNLSKGNFDLHNIYLTGLLAVSPAVKNYGKVAEIISQQGNLISEYKRSFRQFKDSKIFKQAELDYIGSVYDGLVRQSLINLDDLAKVLTAGKFRMSDAERISAIDRIYDNSTEKLDFLRSFNRQAITLSVQRSRERSEALNLSQLYGLKN